LRNKLVTLCPVEQLDFGGRKVEGSYLQGKNVFSHYHHLILLTNDSTRLDTRTIGKHNDCRKYIS